MENNFQDWYDKMLKEAAKAEDLRKFQEMIDNKTLVEPVLVMHPIHKDMIKSSGLRVCVAWNRYIDEDRAYMITDPELADMLRHAAKNSKQTNYEEVKK